MDGRRLGPPDGGERPPWLEPVEEAAAVPAARGSGRLLLALGAAALLLAAAFALYSWAGGEGATEGNGELIRAPAGPYKVPPPDPGGMEVEGTGDSAFATSEGAEPKARIDLSAVPEEPITEAVRKGGTAPAARVEADGGFQLGAFQSEAAAAAAWKKLSARFHYLAPLTHSIVPVERDGRTLYRRRAGGPGAAAACGRLRAAGEEVWC